MSEGSGNVGAYSASESELLRKVKGFQKKEQEKSHLIESFIRQFSDENIFNSNSLLQSVIEDCSHLENESRNLWNENGKLKEKAEGLEKDIQLNNSRFADDMKRQESVFAKAQHDFNLANDDLRKQIGAFEGEISAKNHTLRRLEDECSQLRIDAGHFESKLESLHSEMASLESAMASLHGELSVLQRELDESEKEKKKLQENIFEAESVEKKISQELTVLRQEKDENDQIRVELELQLVEASKKADEAETEIEKRIQGFTSERETLKANFLKKETKLKQQCATNQELNELVSKMHNDFMKEKQDYIRVLDDSKVKVETLESEIGRLKANIAAAEEARDKSSRLQLDMSDKHSSVKLKYDDLQREFALQANDIKKHNKRIDRLEGEKQDLLMEISSKAQAGKDLQASYDALKAEHESAFEDVNEKDKLILQHKVDIQSKDSDIRQHLNDIKEKDDHILVIERQLNEEKKLKEVALEASRTQQREHASRIVESNQKCSRLGSDLSSAQKTIDNLKKQIIDASSLISDYEEEKNEIVKQQASTHTKLQALEDKYEESAARLEASDAELEDVKRQLKDVTLAKQRESEEKDRLFHVELTNHVQKSKKEIDDLQNALNTTKRQAESNLERSLNRARNSFQRQLEDLQTSHHREISDARNRVATVATAMESLQRELAAECSKSSELSSELDVLRELTDTKSSGAEENLARVEKERTKERQNFENFIANLKNQVKSGNKTSSLLQQQLDVATQQNQMEKDERKKVEDNLRAAEEALSKQVQLTDEIESEVFALKRQISENDKKVNYQVQQKNDEIQRVARRNDVLSEAVTRLTQMNSSDRSHGNSMATESKYVFDDSEHHASEFNNGISRGRELNNNNWTSSNGNDRQHLQMSGHIGESGDMMYDATVHKPRTPSKMFYDSSYATEDQSASSTGDVNSSLLRVQQALDSRRKSQSPMKHSDIPGRAYKNGHGISSGNISGGNSRNYNNMYNNNGRDIAQVLHTPERVKTVRADSRQVPRLNFDGVYENEITEDETVISEGKDEGLFATRIRDEVEQGKDRLLPFSPKSTSKKLSNDAMRGSKTERDLRQELDTNTNSKPDRALSAPVERRSREY